MSPRFVLGRENVPCVAEVVNRSLKADCTDFTIRLCCCIELKAVIHESVDLKGLICYESHSVNQPEIKEIHSTSSCSSF